MEIVDIAVNNLVPYDKNPRRNDEAAVKVAESIKQFGFKIPLVVDRNNVVVCGHTRLKAAKKLKLKTVPRILADDLSEDRIKAFRLVDNRTAEIAEWDFALPEEEPADVQLDMTAFDFDDKEQRVPKSLQRAFRTVSRGSLKSHKSRPVEIGDIPWADKIIVMEPENKNDLLQMLGSLHLSDKPRYDRIVSKIISPAQIGGKTAVDDPHRYSPGTIEYGKVVLNLACLTAVLPGTREARRSWGGGKNPKTGNRTTRNPQQARSELDPCPPAYNTARHALHHDICFRRRTMKASGGGRFG